MSFAWPGIQLKGGQSLDPDASDAPDLGRAAKDTFSTDIALRGQGQSSRSFGLSRGSPDDPPVEACKRAGMALLYLGLIFCALNSGIG